MAFKKSTEGHSNAKRRRVLRENYTNSRGKYDKALDPVCYLPKYILEDYEKDTTVKSKFKFLQNLQKYYNDILEEKQEDKIYDEFYFGKLKGKHLSTFGDPWEKNQYIKWCMYVKRNDKNFINSLCHHNEYAKDLALNTINFSNGRKY
tara:strand:+ start:91 stop:534 length:444 start_codon:yes stop_codon:yes gene_type:complete